MFDGEAKWRAWIFHLFAFYGFINGLLPSPTSSHSRVATTFNQTDDRDEEEGASNQVAQVLLSLLHHRRCTICRPCCTAVAVLSAAHHCTTCHPYCVVCRPCCTVRCTQLHCLPWAFCRCCLKLVAVRHFLPCSAVQKIAARFRCVVPFSHSFLCKRLQRGFRCVVPFGYSFPSVVTLPCTLTLLLAVGFLLLLLGAYCSASLFTVWCCVKDCSGVSLCSVFWSQFSMQKTTTGFRRVVPFGHSFPSVVTLPCTLILLLVVGSLPLLLGACCSASLFTVRCCAKDYSEVLLCNAF